MVSLDELADRLDALLDDLARAERVHAAAIASVVPEHRAGAVNLVHHLTLRRHDLRQMQRNLQDVGVTSLAAAQGDVRAQLRAAREVVGTLAGGRWHRDVGDLEAANTRGDEVSRVNAQATLGQLRDGRATRIMVTLPREAAADAGLVRALVDAGMDIARINCARDEPEIWAAMAGRVRTAAAAAGRTVLVAMDCPGPKLRTGGIQNGPAVGRARAMRDESGEVVAPARIWLTAVEAATKPPASALQVPVDGSWLAGRAVGDVIALRDARGRKRKFSIVSVTADGALADCERTAFIPDGCRLRCGQDVTTVRGIPALPQRLSLHPGDNLVLTADPAPVGLPAPGRDARIGCTLPQALAALRPGDRVLFDDGVIEARVHSVAPDEAVLRIERTKPGGQRLGPDKGINLPDTPLPLPALTQRDEELLPFIAAHADLMLVSFLRRAQDVRDVLSAVDAAGGGDLGLILKCETKAGFEHLPSMLLEGMRHRRLAAMVARGDLAVEVGFERMSEVPDQILALCEAGRIPTIVGTQVLESLARTGQASRAEITDAAAAERADCVLLNKGPHIVQAIRTLDVIVGRMSLVQDKGSRYWRRIESWDGQQGAELAARLDQPSLRAELPGE